MNKTMKNPMVHFEIPVDDVNRAKDFYTKSFDWKIEKFDMPTSGSTGGDPYYMVYTSEVDDKQMAKNPGAINGGMMKRKQPGQLFMNYISTESIDDTLKSIKENGGNILMPKTEIGPNMGWVAAFKDTENNIMGLHEFDPQFKRK
jgi:uncharacterized protein